MEGFSVVLPETHFGTCFDTLTHQSLQLREDFATLEFRTSEVSFLPHFRTFTSYAIVMCSGLFWLRLLKIKLLHYNIIMVNHMIDITVKLHAKSHWKLVLIIYLIYRFLLSDWLKVESLK